MDTEPISNRCPKCQSPLPADAPQGLCPKCLLAAVATPTEAGQPAGRPAPPPLEILAAAFPQLEILEFIGQGGMGFVFKARQPKLDRLVALKILPQSLAADPTFAERFNREAKLLARLNHPGIVTVHDFGVTSHQLSTPDSQPFYYLLMEFVDGVNLRQAMQAGRFTPEQALAIVPKICEALQFAHNEGILHRDIKPENILLDAKGRVKIADFGIAKLMERGSVTRSTTEVSNALGSAEDSFAEDAAAGHRPALPNLTEAGKALGTPNYMAPEQLENAGEVDHRADIYSLGVVFYEMLTGELPTGRFAPPSQKSTADPRVDEVVLRALAKEKTKRPASAEEVRTQVETITMTVGSSGRESAPAQPPAPRANQSRLTSAATVQESRFSRMAIVGACWAFSGILHFLVPTLGYRMKSEFVPLMMLFVGLSAPLGATILGWVAVRQIRRSGGGLRGLWLAVFDGLVFPLLAASAACAIGLTLLQQALNEIVSSIFGNGPLFTVGLPICFTVSLLILAPIVLRRVWNAVNAPSGAGVTKSAPRSARVVYKWIAIAFGIIVLLAVAWLMPGRGRSYPASSLRDAYKAPAIGRIEFKCSHPDRPADGTTGTSYAVKAWGDTQWGPTFVLGSAMFKTRVDASRSIFPVAMVAASLDNVHWETRQVALGTNRSTQSLGFSNGLQMAISWEPFGAPAANAKRPSHIQQEVMLRASKLSDAKHPVSTADASRLFGPVIERTLPLDKEGSAGWLDLDSGKLHHENFPSASITATTNGGLAATPLVVIRSVGREQWETITAEQVQQAVGGASFPGFAYDAGRLEGLPKVWLFKTFHGAMGILQLTGFTEKPRGVEIRYKLVQNGSQPNAATPENTKHGRVISQAPFVARLPVGEVELLGVSEFQKCTNASRGVTHEQRAGLEKIWWQADGSPLSQKIPCLTGALNLEGRDIYEIAFRVRSQSNGTPGVEIESIPNSRANSTSISGITWDRRGENMTFKKTLSCEPGFAQTSFRVGAATEPWEIEHSMNFSSEASSGSSAGNLMLSVVASGEETIVTCQYEQRPGQQTRLIALGPKGEVEPVRNGETSGAGNNTIETRIFRTADIKEAKLHLHRRPYRWVEFHNVSLKPGQQTQVEVCGEGSSNPSAP